MKIKILVSYIVVISSLFLFQNKQMTVIFSLISLVSILVGILKKEKLDRIEKFKLEAKTKYMIEARDKLLRSVNHELRAPLSRMKMDLEFIDNKEIQKSLNTDIEQMHDLVNELMEIEKLKVEGLKNTQVSLGKLIRDIIEDLSLDLDKLIFNENEKFVIEGDEKKLSKLFKNLIENAFKYKSDEGNVVINMSNRAENTIVTIMNEGSSISSEDLPFLFEPFFRAKGSDEREQKEGYGIGLNICKEIIDAHRAKIQVSSKKDHGTTFKVTF